MKHVLFITFLFLCFKSSAQDTIFVRSLTTNGRVSNISTDNNYLFARIGDSIYKWDNGFIPFAKGKLKYSSIAQGQDELIINHTEYLSKTDFVDLKAIGSRLLPGRSKYDVTSVTIGDVFYLCYNGIILEYKINPYVEVFHPGVSIRHVYIEPGLRIISTYEGIFMDSIASRFNTNKLGSVNYSSGELSKINSHYYLCQDHLLRYNEIEEKFERWIDTREEPKFRKLFIYEDKIYGLFENTFGQIDLEKRVVTEYYSDAFFTDYEIFDGKLFLSSLDKGLFVFEPGEKKMTKINSISSINDLAQKENKLFLGTDNGLFQLNLEKGFLESIFEGISVIQVVFYNDDFIFTNNDGLTAYREGVFLPIIENVEFNRMALTVDDKFLYAGSVFGLYTIKSLNLKKFMETESIKVEDYKIQKEFNIFYLVLVILIFISGAIYFGIKTTRSKQLEMQSSTIDVKSVVELVRKKKSILSVQDIADYYDTSITQLNRLLKKENTIALSLLKSVKKNIANEMYEDGKSLEEISKRVGYSIRFVREKLL
ncbi:hypothetical protein [Seonamhaeicola maritimus]|uniref:HTH araC/xylS-type domain-containing protein n=1 Tax=Seonamhaeicola maritimus TaxID=2591822 RepID=A0A5C7GEJ7_9FLAO|nr:hypothetical protein [Seonamhaeicola maritimus]TXG34838.1 hypothetical protein FUA22_17200 [Seonamhaeicola maritimus]